MEYVVVKKKYTKEELKALWQLVLLEGVDHFLEAGLENSLAKKGGV